MSKPIKYGSAWKSNAVQAANTAVEVFSAAANARGAIIWLASLCSHNSAGWSVPVMIAKAGVPANVTDGDVLLAGPLAVLGTSSYTAHAKLERSVFVPAGRGLYFINTTADNAGLRHVIYDLL